MVFTPFFSARTHTHSHCRTHRRSHTHVCEQHTLSTHAAHTLRDGYLQTHTHARKYERTQTHVYGNTETRSTFAGKGFHTFWVTLAHTRTRSNSFAARNTHSLNVSGTHAQRRISHLSLRALAHAARNTLAHTHAGRVHGRVISHLSHALGSLCSRLCTLEHAHRLY